MGPGNKIKKEAVMSEAHEMISELYEDCGKAAQVDCTAWVVNGKMMRTRSNDPINDRIIEIAKAEVSA
jgi:hypothetical protein